MQNSIIFAHRYEALQQQGFCVSIANSNQVEMHGHDFLEFSYIARGTMKHTFGGEVETLHQGDYFIVDYGTKHQYKGIGDQPLKVINFLFYPTFVDRMLHQQDSFEKVVNSYLLRFRYRSLNRSPAGIAFHDENSKIYRIVEHIIHEYEQNEAGYLEYIRCLVVEMLILIMRGIGRKEDKSKESAVISQITTYIKKHYMQHLRLSDFSKQYNYSLSHLSKKFQAETQMGFMEYLQHIRVEQACKLLETEDKTISQIADAVGYSDIKFFNKIFKETLGLTPRDFRKMSKQK